MPHNKMLIDATHPEETRVVVLRNGRVEEFDFESAARKLLRGNIYLAKVTRVEPSLQAAFIDYGGNRHGFLAFNEIHPDYYTIPVADRQALLDEEAAADAAEEAEADRRAEARAIRGGDQDADDAEDQAIDVVDLLPPETIEPIGASNLAAEAIDGDDKISAAAASIPPADVQSAFVAATSGQAEQPSVDQSSGDEAYPDHQHGDAGDRASIDDHATTSTDPAQVAPDAVEPVERVGAEDALEELPARPRRRPRSYKIQEVIKRRQIILVQVVKEERGTKGAALTTYLSLAGRYTVLMPNTARGGGISRKITNAQDRKRLKAIAQDLDVPEGMGLIIRTAGAARTAQEIKRDFEYLLRLWENVRDMTLQSTAPSLVYEEGDLIKRSIRDLYTKEVDEILVAGPAAHGEARDFMRMLMPSHAKNVIDYREPEPLFSKFQIEKQLNAMFSPYVNLKSGGYLVINQTEALVAIDINSGKSTREFSIEETALATNMEAADEIARQLKLRDLAGLIVVDFIDMEEKRNNRAVERRIKDALRFDRARIQVGRISHFGLLEMSRQRMRTGVLEGSTTQCPHCQGTGIIRSTESVALAVIRALEDGLIANGRASLVATTSASVALYILNHKRSFIVDMEHRYGVSVTVQASDKMQGSNFIIEKSNLPLIAARRPDKAAVNMDWGFSGDREADDVATESAEVIAGADADESADTVAVADAGTGEVARSRRRRRRRGGRREDGGDGRGRDERGGAEVAGPRVADNEEDERPARLPVGEIEDVGETDDYRADARGRETPVGAVGDDADDGDGDGEVNSRTTDASDGGEGSKGRRGRRRGRRGGRRSGREHGRPADGADNGHATAADLAADQPMQALDATGYVDPDGPVEFARNNADRTGPDRSVPAPLPSPTAVPIIVAAVSTDTPAAAANGYHEIPATVARDPVVTPVTMNDPAPISTPAEQLHQPEQPAADIPIEQIPTATAAPEEAKPTRKGWWQRKLTGE